MDLYYVNLARRTDRREFMEAQFAALGLSATRIDALTPADLPSSDLAAYSDPRRSRWLTPVALSCTSSHLRAMQALLASRAPYALILEDDTVLSTRLPTVLAAFDAAPPALDVLRIETALKPVRTKPDGPALAGVAVSRFVGWDGGAAAYIVTRRGAEVITSSKHARTRFFDMVFFHSSGPLFGALRVRQADPGLAIQTQCLPETSGVATLKSDLDMAAFERQQEAPYYWRHALRRRRDALHRDTVLAVRKAWFLHVEHGTRHVIPFLP